MEPDANLAPWTAAAAIAPSLAVALRAGGGLAVGIALYWLLAEPGEPARRAAARRLLFAGMGVAVFLVLTLPAPRPASGAGRAFEAYVQGVIAARRSFSSSPLVRGMETPEKLLAEAIRHYEAAVRAYPEGATYRRELAVLYAAAGRWADARRAGLESARRLQERRQPRAVRERALWEAAPLSARGPGSGSARYAALIGDARLGWHGDVLRYALARRSGDREATRKALEPVSRQANDYLIPLFIGLIWRFALTIIGGILAVVGLVLIRTRVLTRVPSDRAPVSAVLWEGFLLYMLLSSVPVLSLLAGAPGGTPRSAAAVVGMALLNEGLVLLAVLYLWLRLRSRGFSLRVMGFRSRLLPDVAWGVAAYLASLPFITLASALTQELTERYFPNVAPPYHPVVGLMLADQGPWFRIGLLALLVVGAPFFEEVFFRGTLFRALRQRCGTGLAATLSAGVFAILHPQLPLGFVPIFLLGYAFALLYEWRQSLVPGMVMHAINNGVVFVMMTVVFPR